MNRRMLVSVACLVSIFFLSLGGYFLARAQGNPPDGRFTPEGGVEPDGAPRSAPLIASPNAFNPANKYQPPSSLHDNADGGALLAPAALGEPGFSLRYLTEYGERDVAFFEDSNHFVYPFGLGTDGTNIWIADTSANRAVKFTSDGTYLAQIGTAGDRDAISDTTLETVGDVGVDASGNIWLVDMYAVHIAKFDSSGNFLLDVGERWVGGSDNSHFAQPRSIAFDSAGNVYISDRSNHRVQVFDSSLNYVTTVGESTVSGSDNSHFYNPNKIAIDSSDLLYVGDATNDRVQIFNVSLLPTISYVATLGETGVPGFDNAHFDGPLGVDVDAANIYVADFYNQRIQIFDRTSRAYVATIGTGITGSGNDQFNLPSDVAVDSSGNIYVADQMNFRVQQFDASLNYVRTYGTTGVPYLTDNQHYFRPSGIAVATNGAMHITEELGQRLVKTSAAGSPIWTVGEAGVEGSDNLHFASPSDVNLDSSGNVYVADAGNHRIQVFGSGGSYIKTIGTGWGSGNDQFDWPNGLAVGPGDKLFVTDAYNQRVQVFNSSGVYLNTIGETGVEGSDNAHLSYPRDVHVDNAGNIYIADLGNHRIQVFSPSYVYVLTIGVSGVPGYGYDHLDSPISVSVDAEGRIYVGDQWGGRLQVFDSSGAYLTTIGWLAQVEGIDFDTDGNLLMALYLDHVIEKHAVGVPGWMQRNLNGFGDPIAIGVTSLAVYGGDVFAGVYSRTTAPAALWRQDPGGWSMIMNDGFGNAANAAIDHMLVFDGDLYAGTWADDINGGEVWRSSDGVAWNRVVASGFGDPTNAEVFRLVVFDGYIYAATWSNSSSHGTEIWRSSTGSSGEWNRVVVDGFNGDTGNIAVLTLESMGGYLYAGTWNTTSGGEIWRTDNGSIWTQVNLDGFGDSGNRGVSGIAVFKGYLYVSTHRYNGSPTGNEVWRCQTCDGSDWEQVEGNGFGNPQNRGASALETTQAGLISVMTNYDNGLEVWKTTDGVFWDQVGLQGMGDSYNTYTYWDNATVSHDDTLHLGTFNYANGGEIWLLLNDLFLPLIMR